MFPILNSGALQFKRRRKWQPAPVLMPGKFHGWRSLVGYSPWGHKESDRTEWLNSNNTVKNTGNRQTALEGFWFLNEGATADETYISSVVPLRTLCILWTTGWLEFKRKTTILLVWGVRRYSLGLQEWLETEGANLEKEVPAKRVNSQVCLQTFQMDGWFGHTWKTPRSWVKLKARSL